MTNYQLDKLEQQKRSALTDAQLETLASFAKAATPKDRWPTFKLFIHFCSPDEAWYLAALSPDVVLVLIEELKSLRAANDSLRTQLAEAKKVSRQDLSKSQMRRLAVQSPEKMIEENERLRTQLAEAREVIKSCEDDYGCDSDAARAYLEKYKK